MTLGEAITDAIRNHKSIEAGRIAEFMRFKLNLDYESSMKMVERVADFPDTRQRWEALLYEGNS